MSRKHLAFIINPNSGVDRQKTIREALDTQLDQSIYSYEILHTQHRGHGTELAAQAAAAGAWCVVAVGGDGSVNDVMKGVLGTDTIMAIIPKGSGNGMARTMDIPLQLNEAIALINKGNTVTMDIGFANGMPFMSNAGVGFDAMISDLFAHSKGRGLFNYSWLVTKHLWAYNPPEWKISVNGEEIKEQAFMINVANGRQFGYNFQIAPMADWTDGLLDVIIIKKFPKILGSGLVLRALNGTIASSPYVRHIKATEITITHPDLKIMQTDGDAHACSSEIKFTIKKHAQKVIVP